MKILQRIKRLKRPTVQTGRDAYWARHPMPLMFWHEKPPSASGRWA